MGDREWPVGDEEEDGFFSRFSEDDTHKTVRDHRDLIVWRKGMELAEAVYKATSDFPREELYGLTSQLRRATVSIPTNIAEGYGRGTRGAYLQFLRIAQGSAREIHSLIELSKRLGFLSLEQHETLEAEAIEILKMLGSLIRKLDC